MLFFVILILCIKNVCSTRKIILVNKFTEQILLEEADAGLQALDFGF